MCAGEGGVHGGREEEGMEEAWKEVVQDEGAAGRRGMTGCRAWPPTLRRVYTLSQPRVGRCEYWGRGEGAAGVGADGGRGDAQK